MKRLIYLILAVFALSGCSFFADTYNASTLITEMNTAVTALNQNNQQYEKINQLYTEIETLVNSGSLEADQIAEMQQKLGEIKTLAADYEKKVKEIQEQIPDFQSKAEKLEDTELQSLANTFLADFQATIDAQLKYSETFNKLVNMDEQYANALANGSYFPNEAEYDALHNELQNKETDLLNKINKFNESWNKFSVKVTGNELQDQ